MDAHFHPYEEAFAPIYAKYHAEITAETFGHFAPKPREKYDGYIVFTYTDYGNMEIIRDEFKDLDANPWTYADMNEYVSTQCFDKNREQGCVYRFDGYYEKFKNGNCRFVGKIRTININ